MTYVYLDDEFEYATVKPDGESPGRVQTDAQAVADGWIGEDSTPLLAQDSTQRV